MYYACQHLALFDEILKLTWIELSTIQVICTVQSKILVAKKLSPNIRHQIADGVRAALT
jgi:hypothetical protein